MQSTILKHAVDSIGLAVMTPVASSSAGKLCQLRLYDAKGKLQYTMQLTGDSVSNVTMIPPANIIDPSPPPPTNTRVT